MDVLFVPAATGQRNKEQLMNKIFIIVIALLVVFVATGCKAKEEKIAVEKTTEVPNPQLDDSDVKPVEKAEKVVKPVEKVVKPIEDNSINKWLDDFEQVVVAFENKASKKTLTARDMIEINARLAEMNQKSEESDGWLITQIKRLRSLGARLTAVLQQFMG